MYIVSLSCMSKSHTYPQDALNGIDQFAIRPKLATNNCIWFENSIESALNEFIHALMQYKWLTVSPFRCAESHVRCGEKAAQKSAIVACGTCLAMVRLLQDCCLHHTKPIRSKLCKSWTERESIGTAMFDITCPRRQVHVCEFSRNSQRAMESDAINPLNLKWNYVCILERALSENRLVRRENVSCDHHWIYWSRHSKFQIYWKMRDETQLQFNMQYFTMYQTLVLIDPTNLIFIVSILCSK